MDIEWLFILGMGVAVLALFGRVKALELRTRELESEIARLLTQWRDGMPAAARDGLGQPAPADRSAGADADDWGATALPDAEPDDTSAAEEGRFDALASDHADASAGGLTQEPARTRFHLDLEDVFGRRLPIWAGGIALAIAGVFLVRYSIERGLVTPLLRVVMAFLFGFALLAGAETAYRWRERVADPRVGQALAGAGLATLYAAFYLAGRQYGLIGQTLAFLGLAAVTAGAIALSFRFGLPSAVLGLVGGFAAPALVGGEEANLPLLSLYLGLVTAGLVLSGRRQQRLWMGTAALVGGLGWGAVLLLSGDFAVAEVMALGFYLVVLGAVLPALAGARQFERPLRIGAAAVASVQLALLVDQAGHTPLAWGLYLLLGAALAFFGWQRAEMRAGSAIAGAVAVILLATWQAAAGPSFAVVAAAIAAVFGAVPLAHVWRGADRDNDGWQVAGTSAGLAAVSYALFGALAADRIEIELALATMGLAAMPGLAAWAMRRREPTNAAFAIQLGTAAALVFAALLMVTPGWSAPLAAGAVAAAMFAVTRASQGLPVRALWWGAALVTVLALTAHARIGNEFAHLVGWSQDTRGPLGLLRWSALAAIMAALAWRDRADDWCRFAEGAAVLAIYGALSQVLPRETLAWMAALLALALRYAVPARPVASLGALAIAAAWALEPVGWWLGAGIESLAADPVYASDLPGWRSVASRILPMLAVLAIVRIPVPHRIGGRLGAAGLALPVTIVVAHILFKQMFAIDDAARFVQLGLAERTLWEAVLLAGAWLAAAGLPRIGPQRPVAAALAGAALTHFTLYSAMLHNPLWSAQALGALPLANLATAAYAVAIGAALSLRRWSPARLAPALDGVVMALACLAVLTLLRQVYAGALPAPVPLTQGEDLLRSLAGILLALGFLMLGSRRGERSWRLGSLVIMLAAVAKVFLVDAAGLDGLLRVASFMALGFSLIGIGWIYSRQLRAKPAS